MRILGISGSLRRGSHNRRLLRVAGEALPPGVVLVEWDGLAGIPAFDEDEELTPPFPVARFLSDMAEADALLIATPEYNASVPGALKNALDWVSRPLATNAMRNKPVAVVGASAGIFGAVWAQAEVRKVLGAMGARVADGEVIVGHAMDRFDGDGRLNDPNLEQQVRELAGALIAEARSADPEQRAA
jgi:chromate reductase, NAD(P)H dehydrogenase (quinone)